VSRSVHPSNLWNWCPKFPRLVRKPHIDTHAIFPAPEHILVSYACALAGEVAKSTARNYLSGVRAWHLLHGASWNTSPWLEMAMKAVGVLAPEGKPPRPPVSREMVELLVHGLDFTKPDHICAAAAACVAFWSQSRLGELLSARANSFDERRTLCRSTSGQRHLLKVLALLITLGRRPKGLRATTLT